MTSIRILEDERSRQRRMAWDRLESIVRSELERVEAKPLELGEAVAWMVRVNGKAHDLSAVHHHYENNQTFCRLDIPPVEQHLPVLSSLHPCKRCAAMSRRAILYAKLATKQQDMMATA